MRSIGYILGGRPKNKDDCFDLAERKPVQRVSLKLRSGEEVTDYYVVRWLQATYLWEFDDSAVTYDVTYGGCFEREPAARQRASVDNANRRLAHDLQEIRQRVSLAQIQGQDQRFDYSAVYHRVTSGL